MGIGSVRKIFGLAVVIVLSGSALTALAQDKPADNMQIVREKIRADKKWVVASSMELT